MLVREGVGPGDEIVVPSAEEIDEDDVVPATDHPAWSGDAFIVTTRQAADAEIIFNNSNFGPYEKPGPQTFRLPASR